MTHSMRTSKHDVHPPQIACPMCKATMRLATAEPALEESELRLTFTCDCGFDCRMFEHQVNDLGQGA